MRDKQISTRGLGQALVRRRVSLLYQILKEHEIDATIEKIESVQNKDDVLSRIPKAWMNSNVCCFTSCDERLRTLRTHHENHHQGVERTLYLPNRVFLDHKFRRSEAVEIIKLCDRCLRIVHDFSPGDAVFIRPPGSRCFTKWPMQVVTGAGNGLSVEVAGIPRHIADIRKATDCKNYSGMSILNANNYNEPHSLTDADDDILSDTPYEITPSVQRKRNAPPYLRDYVMM
ncbi:hypothetical protein GJ496_011071 [Pomphorhynchus laevis]|nr:hypothetical protein GJ496_011071 [Pomphorhynchus laevis]